MSAELFRQLRRVEAQAEKGIRRQAGGARGAPAPAPPRAAPPAPHLQRGLPPRRPPGRRLRPAVGPGLCRLHGRLPRHPLSPGGGGRAEGGRGARAHGPGGAGRLRPRRAPPAVRPGPHGHLRRRDGALCPAGHPGAPLHAVGPGAPGGPRGAEPARLRGHGAHGLRQPDLHAAGALSRRRPAALQPLPEGAGRERLPEGLRPVPGDHAGRAGPALPEVRRLALHGRAQREGVGGRPPRHPHRHVAGLHQVRHAHAARADRQAAHHRPRAGVRRTPR